ncbi:hypothetical protein C2G38_2035657 [Gigaspora rosea]|uniref:Tyrosinase copper-binding domain-containing protein n=1 Tax=Gigaspora rosea TaxID=44941 RepID=A0A397VBT6_9GLOM|nr:hypothetical protein C2G38_2035657 [Gigaspora rosea]
MVQHALMTLVIHHPEARKRRIKFHPIFVSSLYTPGSVVGDKPIAPTEDVSGEQFLDYWREDPNLNEHHEHWHIVYTDQPLPDPLCPDDKSKEYIKVLQGELFIYMHRQMNARYIAECLGVGLGVTKPLENYHEIIPESYTPSKHLVDNNDQTTFSARASGLKLADIGNIRNGKARNLIRKTVEQEELDSGVIRDPAFWRWHRHVDNLFKAYQEKLGLNHFNDCSPVKISSDGIILCFKDKIPCIKGLKDPQQDEEASKWGEQTFGGHHFHKEHCHNCTDVLETKMKQRQFTWVEDDQSIQTIEYLFSREWYDFLNITLTFRVFIVPVELCNNFTEWIEVDKFKQETFAGLHNADSRDITIHWVDKYPDWV